MIRSEILKEIAPILRDQLVVCNIGIPSQELHAIDDQPTRDNATESLHSSVVPQSLPAGYAMHYPQGSLGTTLRFLIAVLFILLALLLKRTRRELDTSVVCTPIKAGKEKC